MNDRLHIIAAVDRHGAIGRGGDLLFHISADLRRFKQLTSGHTVVMGRRTFESLPKGALPNRRNIVLTTRPDYTAPGIETAPNLDAALDMALSDPDAEVFVIGGASVYREAMDRSRHLHLTHIDAEGQAPDTYFPPVDTAQYRIEAQPIQTDPTTGVRYHFADYTRL